MYNILVVDDDAAIRESICRLTSESCTEEHRLFQAENGMKAVETVCSNPIDIIFADVKMPGCTGIEMMEMLKKLNYWGQIVIISGFDDYNLVRRAMKLGAVDYLLKPIVAGEFVDLLHLCMERVKGQNNPTLSQWQSSGDIDLKAFLAQQYTVERLMEGETETLEAFCTQYPVAPLSPVAMYTLDIVDFIGNAAEVRQSLFQDISHIVSMTLDTNRVLCLQGAYQNQWIVLLIPINAEEPADLRDFRSYLGKKYHKFGETEQPYPIDQLQQAYAACTARLERYFYDLPEDEGQEVEAYPYTNTLNQMVEAVCSYNFNAFSELLRALFYTLCKHKPPVGEVRNLLVGAVYSILSKNSRYISVISKHKFTPNDITQVIQDSAKASFLRKSLIEIMHIYIQEATDQNNKREDYAIKRAKSYIESRYMNDISLTELSEHLELHPNYLSTLFKNKTGTTYTQYLRGIRIEKAKDLMRMTNMKLYEVAELVGYKDNAHFYRAFKDATGMSPAEYKKRMDVVIVTEPQNR